MGNDITIVTSANCIRLTKTFSSPHLKVKLFEIDKDFMTSERAVFELKSLAEVLQRHHSKKVTHPVLGNLCESYRGFVS